MGNLSRRSAPNFNRISGKNYGAFNSTGSSFNAENNFWGCNTGPNTAGCDAAGAAGGTIDFNPYLILSRTTASQSPVNAGGTSTITTNLRYNSANFDTFAATDHLPNPIPATPTSANSPNGVPVNFSATNGTVSDSVKPLVDGLASTTFTGGAVDGGDQIAIITARVDNATNTASVTVLDAIAPTVSSANVASSTANTVTYTVTFSEAVTGVDASDFAVTTTGNVVASVTNVSADNGNTRTVIVAVSSGMGTIRLDVLDDNTIIDTASAMNPLNGAANNPTFNGQTANVDVQMPTVTINQAAGQSDPTSSAPINFTVVFSEPVTGFTGSDVVFTGSTAGGTLTATVTGSGANYNVAVSGMTSNGTVIASIPANAAIDNTNNGNFASTSTDNSVTYLLAGVTRIRDNVMFTTIQGGIDDVGTVSGDTLLASPGVYNERIVVNKSITIQGAQHGVLAKPRNNPNTESTIVVDNSQTLPVNLQTDNITIDGFAFDITQTFPTVNNSDKPGSIISGNGNPGGDGYQNINVLNNRLPYDTGNADVASLNRNGFFMFFANNLTIEGNYFAGFAGQAVIVANGSTNFVYRNNDSYNNADSNVGTQGNFGGPTTTLDHTNVLIENNRSDQDSMILFLLKNSTIRNNTLTAGTLGSSRVYLGGGSNNVSVETNTFALTSSVGIQSFDPFGYGANSNINFIGNTMTRTIDAATTGSFSAIDYRGTGGTNTIANNTVTLTAGTLPTGNSSYAIRIRGSASGNFNITGNFLNGNGVTSNTAVKPAGLYISSNTSGTPVSGTAGPGDLGQIPASSVLNINCNTFRQFQDGITVYNAVTNTVGGLPTGIDVNSNGDNFLGNSQFGINNGGTSETIDATNSYWNSPSGPSGAGPGSGDAVTANVNYTPFLTSPSMCAPINTVPGTQTINQDTTRIFSAANGNQISIADADVLNNPVTVTLSVTNGTVTLSQTTGLTFTTGDGTADATMTFSGTLANVNAALNNLAFTPNAGFVGTSTLTMMSSSMGSPGVGGGTQSDTDTVTINVLDAIAPTVLSINRGTPSTQNTNASTVIFNVTFSEPVTGVDAADFQLTGTINYGAATIMVSADTGATRTVTVTGYTGDGTLGLNLVDNDSIADTQGNKLGGTGTVGAGNGSFTGQTYTIDQTRPTVQITQAAGQNDPTTASPINFTVTFSEAISGFDAGDVVVSGTAGATAANVAVTPPSGSGTTFNVQVTPPISGTVIININQNVASDAFGNGNFAFTPGAGSDNSVTYFTTATAMAVDDDGQANVVNGVLDCDALTVAPTQIQTAINLANSGDTIYVCPGVYPQELSVNKPLTLLGPKFGVNPNSGTRTDPNAEAIIYPTSSDASFNGPILVSLRAQNITFNGFTLNGDNPTISGGTLFNGADVNAGTGIEMPDNNFNGLNNPQETISNNIIKNIGELGVDLLGNNAGGNANSTIQNNKFDNIPGITYGAGIYLGNNGYANVTGNVLTQVSLGIVIENFSQSGVAAASVSNNRITANRIGIRYNLHYNYSTNGFTLSNNTIDSYIESTDPTATRFSGIRVESINGTVPVTFSNNTITPNRAALQTAGYNRIDGIFLTNTSTISPNIAITGNTISNALRGISHNVPAVPTVTCNLLRNNDVGIYVGHDVQYQNPGDPPSDSYATGGIEIHQNNFFNNASYGVQSDTSVGNAPIPAGSTTIPAANTQNNFWGAPNGPSSDGTSTATGSGDKVSTNVNFTPFLTALATCAPTVPTLAISDATVTEGNSGTVTATFTVTLSNPDTQTVTVTAATADGTATTANNDYVAVPPTVLTFAPGTTTQTVNVTVNGDTFVEPNETFAVNLSGATNAAILDNQGLGTITNDDAFGTLGFSSATYSISENGGTATITVTRTGGSAQAVSVQYATSNGSATGGAACGSNISGIDYVTQSGTLNFAGGVTSQSFTIPICDDILSEAINPETVNLSLSNIMGGAALGLSSAVLNITDNDGGGSVTISGNIKQFQNPGPNTNLQGVPVTLSGSASCSTTTDANGNYSFNAATPCTIPAGGSYQVTPSSLGKIYDPIYRNYSSLNVNVTNADFIAYNSINDVPRKVRVGYSTVTPGNQVTVPIKLESLGNENGVSFSLTYNTARLSSPVVTLGADVPAGSALITNPGTGVIGIIVTAPPGQTFGVAGTKEIVKIQFNAAANSDPNTPLTFTNSPIVRNVNDANANPRLSQFINGVVVFAQGLEADVDTRPNGDNDVDLGDFNLVGQFAAGLATPDYMTSNEFQRADCEPTASKGDADVDLGDFIQAGRYAAVLDPTQTVGGSAYPNPLPPNFRPTLNADRMMAIPRIVTAANVNGSPGNQVTVGIQIDAEANDKGVSFTMDYDAAKLSNPQVSLGPGGSGGFLVPNTTMSGKVIVQLAYITGGFQAGISQIILIKFDVAANAPAGLTPLTFNDTPVQRQVRDTNNVLVTSNFVNGSVNVAGPTAAPVGISGRARNASGKGVFGAIVRLTDEQGNARSARTDFSGRFAIADVPAGRTYILSVESRAYTFAPQVITVSQDLVGFDLILQPSQLSN